ncbi:MAG: type II toxin-antitoxin system VapC family toxin [Mesorhizobium sp.]|nr:type II toxin-antitoxin system VapC family toxin [Mesorhizobium sp.]MBN9245493.1 type II toxin-antitoxin system VapC family toxin [Mesorhizobium sp.]
MNYYLDTSVIVSVLTEESHTARSERWFADHGGSPKLISWWVDVEWSAAISMKVRMGALDQDGRALVETAFRQLVDASFTIVPVEHGHFVAASDLARRSNGLRAGDALHLAVAGAQGATVCTLDAGMARAAESLGLPVVLV